MEALRHTGCDQVKVRGVRDLAEQEKEDPRSHMLLEITSALGDVAPGEVAQQLEQPAKPRPEPQDFVNGGWEQSLPS
jgi:hypothetical protein